MQVHVHAHKSVFLYRLSFFLLFQTRLLAETNLHMAYNYPIYVNVYIYIGSQSAVSKMRAFQELNEGS